MSQKVSTGVAAAVIAALVAVIGFFGFRAWNSRSHSGPTLKSQDYETRMNGMRSAGSSTSGRPGGGPPGGMNAPGMGSASGAGVPGNR